MQLRKGLTLLIGGRVFLFLYRLTYDVLECFSCRQV